ncbi:MAG: RAMP superfamily CRISPR-associated protein, partial [Campylobacter sp.]|nr:RAMP superfamily CRISPR-associated protein [Campylobacter sp.]
MITAPYNFVPLNEKVFYPSWADEVSHDVPLKDGQSGVIELEITAKSPIFIKNGKAKDEKNEEKKDCNEFCHFLNKNGEKEYYIPASSIKGMLRNVLEIMSFSKIRMDENRHKKHLSVRDMTNKILAPTAKNCGFLVKNGDKIFLKKCEFKKISHKELNSPKLKDIPTAEQKYKEFLHLLKQKTGLVFTGSIDNKKKEFLFTETNK